MLRYILLIVFLTGIVVTIKGVVDDKVWYSMLGGALLGLWHSIIINKLLPPS